MRLLSTLSLVSLSLACVEEPKDTTEPDCTAATNCIDPEPQPNPDPVTSLAFATPVSLGEVDSMERVSHGDVDGDGHVDLVHGYLDSLVWLKGDGQGGFSDEPAAWTSELLPEFVELLGEVGEASLSEGAFISHLHELTLADFDGDGRDDLLVAFSIQDDRGAYWSAVGTANLNSSSWEIQLLDFNGAYVSAEVIADLDSDGGAEVLIYTFEGCFLSRSGGPAEFLSEAFAGNYYPQSWTTHVDDDGRLDIVSFYNGGYGVTGVSAFLATEDGGFEEQPVEMLDFGHTAVGNGDHRTPATEIFLAANDGLYWLEGGESPALQDAGTFFDGLFVWSAVFGDFTGSGDLDVLARNPDEQLAYSGDGAGGFEWIELEGLQIASDEVAVDLNKDGLDDLYRIEWSERAQARVLEVIVNTSRR